MSKFTTEYHRKMGKESGYPLCCVEFFCHLSSIQGVEDQVIQLNIQRWDEIGEAYWDVEYVECEECYKRRYSKI